MEESIRFGGFQTKALLKKFRNVFKTVFIDVRKKLHYLNTPRKFPTKMLSTLFVHD